MSDSYRPVLLTLPGSLTPTLAVEILPHGVTIHRIIVQVGGKTHDIVIGPENPEDHSTVKYTNSIIGRYVNRVPVGTHVVEKSGITSSFEALPNESSGVSLHGGPTGFDFAAWHVLERLDDATLFTKAEVESFAAKTDASVAIFSLTSLDGDQGYSGTLYLEVLVALLPPEKLELGTALHKELGSIVIIYRAKLVDLPHAQKKVTPINLTQHWGFNLDASLHEGEETQGFEPQSNHRGESRLSSTLSLPPSLVSSLSHQASHVAELQPNFLSSGRYISVAEADNGSGAHMHDNKRMGDLLPGVGYDDYYLLRPRSDLKLASPHRIPVAEFTDGLDLVNDILTIRNNPVLKLSSDKSGLAVGFDSNQAGLMLYTNNHTDIKGYRKKIHGGTGFQGDGYIPHSAAFIEFHEPLSAFLYPTSASTDTLLTSEEIYNNYVRADIVSRSNEARE